MFTLMGFGKGHIHSDEVLHFLSFTLNGSYGKLNFFKRIQDIAKSILKTLEKHKFSSSFHHALIMWPYVSYLSENYFSAAQKNSIISEMAV